MEVIRKGLFRLRQFGGWRLLRAYAKAGVLPVVAKEVARVIIQRRPLKEAYPAVGRKIVPMLQERYRPLVKELAEKYQDERLVHEKSDVVWFCWMQGMEQAPELVKVCLASQKRWVRGKRFVVITQENYRDYVTLPEDIVRMNEKGIIPHSNYTDLIRLELLIKYGGTWIDSTVLFAGDNYPDKIMDCDLFFFQYLRKGQNGFAGISSWFISAYSQNRLLMILRDMLWQYWRDYDCVVYYYIFHLCFALIAEEFPEEVAAMPKGNSYRTVQMAEYLDEAYDKDTMMQLTALSSIHKLDYRKNRLLTKDKKPTFYSHIIKGA